MYGFPHSHSFRSQSQVDFAQEDIGSIDYRGRRPEAFKQTSPSDYPLFGNITGYEVVMQPGDVLYIPPMWYHRVVTEDASIMINTWTNAPEGDAHLRLEMLPLPLEEEWTLEQKAAGLLLFFKSISAHLPFLKFPNGPSDAEWSFLCVFPTH